MFAKPQIKCEQIINMAHKLTSLQAYNFLQVDTKEKKVLHYVIISPGL